MAAHKEFNKRPEEPLAPWANGLQTALIFAGIIFGGCLIAGVYGILHDQLTYSISPEYYTRFKFYQFELVDEGSEATVESPRLWVSVVGFLATWWMGIPIAMIVGLFSLHSDRKLMINIAVKAFLVIIAVAFLTGLVGLYVGYAYLANEPKENFTHWFIPNNLVDFKSFIAVGTMHYYSYLGGILGTFVGFAYIQWRKRKKLA